MDSSLNWEAIGAAGETLGAIAVLITLVFLVFQLRQNTRAIEAESARSSFEEGTTWMYEIVRDPAMAKLYREGLSNELSAPDDRLRFHMLMQALFNHWAIAYVYRSGKFVGVSESDVARVLATPGGARYWKRAQEAGLHSAEFRNYVNSITVNPGSEAQ